MKRNGLKSMKSVVIAVSLCAGLAVGILGAATIADLEDTLTTVAAWPGFLEGLY